MANPSRSMGSLKGFCTTKAKALDDFLDSVKDRDITSNDVTIIKELRQALKEQFDRMHLKWEAFITADPDPFENDEVFTKCKKDYDESQVLVDKHMVVSKITLDRALSDGAPQAEGATGATNIKIDETLKPKELLATSMTLEEADEWFRGYKAFLKHNERALKKLDVQVNQALLNKSIEAKLSSALRALPGVLDTTSIADPNGCLEKLRGIFLDKNPLWLRRHYYFKCVQGDHETVNEWWAKKIDKARECALATITADEIRILELIRGVKSFKLRQEFLRQSDPTLEGLLKIAKNWQVADDVEKGLGATSTVDSRKTSSYQKDKSAKWQSKAGSGQAQGPGPSPGPGKDGQVAKCGWCGRPSHPRDQCPAREKTCNQCGIVGHYAAVCKSGSKAQSRGRSRNRSRGRGGQQTTQTSQDGAGVRSGRVSMDRDHSQFEVRCGRVAARAFDDAEATPLMEDVLISPTGQKTRNGSRMSNVLVHPSDSMCSLILGATKV